MSALVGPALFPFSLAAAVMGGLVLVEALSLLAGQSASALLDGALGHDGIDAVEPPDGLSPAALLSWINLGRVPFWSCSSSGSPSSPWQASSCRGSPRR